MKVNIPFKIETKPNLTHLRIIEICLKNSYLLAKRKKEEKWRNYPQKCKYERDFLISMLTIILEGWHAVEINQSEREPSSRYVDFQLKYLEYERKQIKETKNLPRLLIK